MPQQDERIADSPLVCRGGAAELDDGFISWDIKCGDAMSGRLSWHGNSAYANEANILELLTPERISEPRAELVIAAVDETGELARAELARWTKEKTAAAKGFLDLSPGYPKVVTYEDYPALPEGKHYLLLGICKGGRGVQLGEAINALFPMTAEQRKAGELEHGPIRRVVSD